MELMKHSVLRPVKALIRVRNKEVDKRCIERANNEAPK